MAYTTSIMHNDENDDELSSRKWLKWFYQVGNILKLILSTPVISEILIKTHIFPAKMSIKLFKSCQIWSWEKVIAVVVLMIAHV